MPEPLIDKSLVLKLYALCPKADDPEAQASCWCPVCEAAYILDNIDSIEIPERDSPQ
jgi:hypothetical protein